MPEQISRNARVGAIALAIFAPAHGFVTLQGPDVSPLAFACWLGVSFGILCLCEELGAARPLNRAGLVLFGAAFCGRLIVVLAPDPTLNVRAQLLYAFAAMGALAFWSAALMHRPNASRAVGILGAAASGSTLALILVAHLMAGSATIWGFSRLFSALVNPALDTSGATTTINMILALWGLVTAGLLWTHSLRSAD